MIRLCASIGAAFTENVEFSAEPEYGWKAHPTQYAIMRLA